MVTQHSNKAENVNLQTLLDDTNLTRFLMRETRETQDTKRSSTHPWSSLASFVFHIEGGGLGEGETAREVCNGFRTNPPFFRQVCARFVRTLSPRHTPRAHDNTRARHAYVSSHAWLNTGPLRRLLVLLWGLCEVYSRFVRTLSPRHTRGAHGSTRARHAYVSSHAWLNAGPLRRLLVLLWGLCEVCVRFCARSRLSAQPDSSPRSQAPGRRVLEQCIELPQYSDVLVARYAI